VVVVGVVRVVVYFLGPSRAGPGWRGCSGIAVEDSALSVYFFTIHRFSFVIGTYSYLQGHSTSYLNTSSVTFSRAFHCQTRVDGLQWKTCSSVVLGGGIRTKAGSYYETLEQESSSYSLVWVATRALQSRARVVGVQGNSCRGQCFPQYLSPKYTGFPS
jgi:hypothetical protein